MDADVEPIADVDDAVDEDPPVKRPPIDKHDIL